jgi:hypothetical protein
MSSTNVTDAKCNVFFFNFHEVSEVEVRDVIKQLKNNNTKDIFGFSTSLVKTVQNCLISPITKLFNCAVRQGLFPDPLKKAAVAPIFKKGNAEDVNIIISFLKFLKDLCYLKSSSSWIIINYVHPTSLVSERTTQRLQQFFLRATF